MLISFNGKDPVYIGFADARLAPHRNATHVADILNTLQVPKTQNAFHIE